jgi:YVTN family beta-propeller protein
MNVGDEPQSVALSPLDTVFGGYAYVANAAENTVSVIQMNSSGNAVGAGPILEITTGAEPWNVVVSPDGKRVYVANSVQDTITIINNPVPPALPTIIGNVPLNRGACNSDNPDRHFQPRGLAVTPNNSHLYVTRFLSFVKSGGQQANDGGKEGLVCRLTINTSATTLGASVTLSASIKLQPTVTGFPHPTIVTQTTTAYPNQMQSIVIRGTRAFLPNIAASPSGPLKFNVDTEAYVNVIGSITATTPTDLGALNLHLGARDPEPGKTKLFFANPWAMAFTNQSGTGNAYVVSAASDLLVKLNVDASHNITFTGDISTTRYIDLNDPNNPTTSGRGAGLGLTNGAGKNPLGIIIFKVNNLGNDKAYVMNYVSRNVSVVDLSTDTVSGAINFAPLPPASSKEEQLLVGAEIFFSSRGNFTTTTGVAVAPGTSLVNRLSSEGWQACSSCHFNGWTDGEVWAFGAGPRKSVPLNATWSPHNPNDQRILNYSAIFDEVQDFELNIRNVSGPGGTPPVLNQGLIISDTGTADAPPAVINAFSKANAGRPQLAVLLPGSTTRWPALDAMTEWVRFAIRTPNGALTTSELNHAPQIRAGHVISPNTPGGNVGQGGIDVTSAALGRNLFFQAGCASCHGGTKWTLSSKDFTSPPSTANVFTEAGANLFPGTNPLTTTQFYSSTTNPLRNVGSFNLNVTTTTQIPGQPLIGGVEKATNGQDALGRDYNGDGNGNGYNTPSLLGIWNLPPYYHNGACETLACVVQHVAHRTASGRPDVLTNATERARLVDFLKTLDANTNFPTTLTINPGTPFAANSHDIFLDPPTVYTGTPLIVGANVQLFGTKTDLANIIADLGITNTFVVKISVLFSGSGLSGIISQTFPIKASDFNHNFGFATYSMTVNVPNNIGQGSVTVVVDPNATFPGSISNAGLSFATSLFPVRPRPSDRTPPTVHAAFISDDTVFNDADAIATTTNVKVKIVASDPISVVNGFTTTTGVQSYCIVHYYYSRAQRRWIPTTCGTANNSFTPLPAPTSGNNISGTFIVTTTIGSAPGTAYAFVHVKDGAGNISRFPAFDVISYIPSGNIDIERNDARLFRILMPPGQALTMTMPIIFGDVDATLFDGVLPTAARIQVSANVGTITETIVITSSNTQVGNKLFQVEVRAFVNSRFRILVSQAACPACRIIEVDAADSTGSEPTPLSITAPTREGDVAEPMVAGPPAAQSAIGDIAVQVFLPLVVR